MPAPDSRELLFQMLGPMATQLAGVLHPEGVRRVVESLFAELDDVFVPAERREARARHVTDNALHLGLVSPGFDRRRFLHRHLELQIRRQAEEVVCIFTPVERQIEWANRTAKATGLSHARGLLRRGGAAVLVSAHLGPMVYYGPVLSYFLAQEGTPPDMAIVTNPPSNERIDRQLEQFGRLHGSRMRCIVKPPDDADGFRASLDDELARGAWVLMQVDVRSGGRSTRTVDMFGTPLRMPAIWGAVRLAARHRVPIVPTVAARTRDEGVHVRMEAPFDTAPGQDEAQWASRVASRLERWVRRGPADWAMLPQIHRMRG